MNKRQWFASADLDAMLSYAQPRASDRKLRLFAVACCRRFWPALSADDQCRQTVETAERFADGTATVKACRLARSSAEVLLGPEADRTLSSMRRLSRAAAKLDARGAALDASDAALALARERAHDPVSSPLYWTQTSETARAAEVAAQIRSLRCMFCYPVTPQFNPEWRTDTVRSLAEGMYESRDFSATPILADALQDAGCTHTGALHHLQQGSEHVRGCWVLDWVLGNE